MNMIYSLNGLELIKGIFRVDMAGVLGDVYK